MCHRNTFGGYRLQKYVTLIIFLFVLCVQVNGQHQTAILCTECHGESQVKVIDLRDRNLLKGPSVKKK